jgi:RNA-directed DNA polymerase
MPGGGAPCPLEAGRAEREAEPSRAWSDMKRIGNLFEKVVESENLRLAFWKASQGKRHRPEQRAFAANLSAELERMRAGLLAGDYPVGNYTRFKIFDPKEREICAAAFPERVLHHALMNVCEPHFEKWLIFDTYACRKGKGQFKAVRRAQGFARQYDWFLKADVRKFFDSIAHDRLKALLRRKFKDDQLLFWFDRIVDTYETQPGRGLPIGNLTSQYFANFYLDPLDRFVKETLRIKGYVRYMDDFSLWHSSRRELKNIRHEVVAFASDSLGLTLKGEPYLNRTRHGMDFLGMRVSPDAVRLNRRSKKRFISKVRHYEWLLACGRLSEDDFQERVTALTAFVRQADTLAFRQDFFNNVDEASCLVTHEQSNFRKLATNVGLEPEHPGRELEQQREQRALRQRELEQPGQREQQQRLPRRLPLSTIEKLEERRWYPPVSCSRQRNKERMVA